MAEPTLSTPGAISRRSLSTAASALLLVAASGVRPAGSAALPGPVPALLNRYRDLGVRLRELRSDYDAAFRSVPAWARPEVASDGGIVTRLPAWSPAELAALAVPPGLGLDLPFRPSLADLIALDKRVRQAPDELRAGRKRAHGNRLAAWTAKLERQEALLERAGIPALDRRRREIARERAAVGRALLAALSGEEAARA